MLTTKRARVPKANGHHTKEVATPEAKKFRFPSAFTVLFGVTVAVWLLAFFVPTGAYQTDAETGGPIPGSYEGTDSALSLRRPADGAVPGADQRPLRRDQPGWLHRSLGVR